jgi:hypothetical protein
MSLLWGRCYDPATPVTKSTATTIGMTAIDTSNLQASFDAPANGSVLVRMQGTLHGATTYPQILFGVLNNANGALLGRTSPMAGLQGTALATSFLTVESLFLVTGLTPGAAQVWNAAYSVETLMATSGLKYGGPNGTTANDAWGGFVFECWTT